MQPTKPISAQEEAMSAQAAEFRKGAIRPVECLSAGWQLVKRQYWLMVGITAVGILVGSLGPFGVLMGPMMCGIHLCMFALMRNEEVSFNLLFKGFDFFVQSLIAALVQVLPVLVIMIPCSIVFGVAAALMGASSGGRDPGPEFAVGLLIGYVLFFALIMLVSIVVGTLFMFAFQLIAERRLSGIDACKVSAKAALANVGGALGLIGLNMLLGLAGMLLCYVGAFLLLPIGIAALDVAYRQVFPPPPAAPGAYAPPL
jgi:hypothetical protein